MLLSCPELMLQPPQALQSYVAAAQAQSGLSIAQVAAVLVQQPHLMLAGTATTGTDTCSAVGQTPRQQQAVGRSRQHW
jgi:hypothetical protein